MRLTKLSRSRLYGVVLALIAGIGLIDATLLTQEHYSGRVLPCTITHGCGTVLSSKYSEILGVPLAVLGLVFYFSVLLVAIYFVQSPSLILKKLLLALGTIGFVSSLGLVYIQGAILHAWCQYCLLSALSSTMIFIFSILLYITKEDKHEKA